ncbi:MAG TPA: ribosome silencing factor [Nitrospiria bacterium]|nr:ribosome silencing factor [Nitrospiria bacterium]
MKKKYFNQRVTLTISSKEKARTAAMAALSKKAEETVVYEIKKVSDIADYFVICSADSQPQIRAILDEIMVTLEKKGVRPLQIEGAASSHWVLIDYEDVIVHIFRKETREFYNLDGLWGDSPVLDLDEAILKTQISKRA